MAKSFHPFDMVMSEQKMNSQLDHCESQLDESLSIAISTMEDLNGQREKIGLLSDHVVRIDRSLGKSGAVLNRIIYASKREKIIALAVILVAILVIIGMVYLILKK